MAARETRTKSKPYSTRSWPSSSFHNRIKRLFIYVPPFQIFRSNRINHLSAPRRITFASSVPKRLQAYYDHFPLRIEAITVKSSNGIGYRLEVRPFVSPF